MRGCGIHLLFLTIALGCSGYFLIAAESAKETTPAPMESLATVQKNIAEKKAVLVDVRSEKEWKAGHLDGAIHMPVTDWKQAATDPAALKAYLAKNLPAGKIVYVHCMAGGRAKSACNYAADSGYDLQPLAVEYDDLVKAGFKEIK